MKSLPDEMTLRILTELSEIRRAVEDMKKQEADRVLEEGLFRTLEQGTRMGIFILQDGRFTFVNRHAENQWGYTLEEFIDRDGMSLVHPDDRENTHEAVVQMLKGRRSKPFIFRVLTKNGSIRWLTETVVSIPYKGRRAVLANYMDITEQVESQKKLEELEALEASILEAMPNAVIGLRNRRIIFANDGVDVVLGWKAQEIIGKSTRILYRSDKDYDEIAHLMYDVMESRRTANMEFRCRHKDGSEIECAISAARIGKYLQEKNIVVIYEDIMERKQEKNELEQSREQLRKLTAHLQSVREKERTLIARELHDEIGQLLTALNTETVLLGKKIPPEQKALIERVQGMTSLIDMTMQSLKRIYMSLRPGMLDHLGLSVSIGWQADEFAKRTGIPCQVKVHPDDMSLDPDLSTALFRIFQETLTNISRHADATRVWAQLKVTAKKVQLIVKDNGRGITPEQRQKPHSFGLLGIRERAASWGGRCKDYGRRRKRNDHLRFHSPQKERNQAMKKIEILIADDHPIVRAGFKQVISETQDMVVADEAGNGQEVLNFVRKRDYDIVLLDISMPGRNGLEIIKDLKLEKPKIPVMILSIYPEEQYAIRALRAGASGYMTKASAPHELIAAIRKICQGGKYISSALAEKLTDYLDADATKQPHEILSDREYQVMRMIASGKTVSHIADELCLSVKTISTYRSHILDKMKLKNNAEITLYAVQNNLIG